MPFLLVCMPSLWLYVVCGVLSLKSRHLCIQVLCLILLVLFSTFRANEMDFLCWKSLFEFRQHCSYNLICNLFQVPRGMFSALSAFWANNLATDQIIFLLKVSKMSSVVTKDTFIFALHDSAWVAVCFHHSISDLSGSCFYSRRPQSRQSNRHETNICRR